MSSAELHELHEMHEHTAHDRSLLPVSLTMAILAVVVATASLLGHRAHTEEVLLQDKITDGWGYYQAKNIRLHTDQAIVDLAMLTMAGANEKTAAFFDKYKAEVQHYTTDKKEAEAKARKLEEEVSLASRRADRYDGGEVFLEIALIVTSITLLSKNQKFWYAGIVIGIVGTAIAVSGLLRIGM